MLEVEVMQKRQSKDDSQSSRRDKTTSSTGPEDQNLSRMTDSRIISKLKVSGLLGVTSNSEGKV